MIGFLVSNQAGEIADLREEKGGFLTEFRVVGEEHHILGAGDDSFLEDRLAIVGFRDAASHVEAAAGKKHAMDVEAMQGLFGDEADVRTRARIIESAGADQIQVATSFECGEDIQRIGQNGERVIGQVFGESENRRRGIEENRFIRLDASSGFARDGGFFLTIRQLSLRERNLLTNFEGTGGTAMDANQVPAFFECLKVFAHGLVRHIQQGGNVHRADVSRCLKLLQDFLLSLLRQHNEEIAEFVEEDKGDVCTANNCLVFSNGELSENGKQGG